MKTLRLEVSPISASGRLLSCAALTVLTVTADQVIATDATDDGYQLEVTQNGRTSRWWLEGDLPRGVRYVRPTVQPAVLDLSRPGQAWVGDGTAVPEPPVRVAGRSLLPVDPPLTPAELDYLNNRGPKPAPVPLGLQTYAVQVTTPRGMYEVDVPTTLGPEAAERRAFWSIIAKYGRSWNPAQVKAKAVGRVPATT